MIKPLTETVYALVIRDPRIVNFQVSNAPDTHKKVITGSDAKGVGIFISEEYFADDVEIVCLASKSTDEQAKRVVERVTGWDTEIYYNYTSKGDDYRDVVESAFKSPIRSLHSLLLAQKCYLRNPNEKPDKDDYGMNNILTLNSFRSLLYYRALERWKQFEENTGDWLLIKKLK